VQLQRKAAGFSATTRQAEALGVKEAAIRTNHLATALAVGAQSNRSLLRTEWIADHVDILKEPADRE